MYPRRLYVVVLAAAALTTAALVCGEMIPISAAHRNNPDHTGVAATVRPSHTRSVHPTTAANFLHALVIRETSSQKNSSSASRS